MAHEIIYPFPIDIEDYTFERKKSGGAQKSGRFGGWYRIKKGPHQNKLVMLKLELHKNKPKCRAICAELVTGRIIESLLGNDAAHVFLVSSAGVGLKDHSGQYTYIGSVAVEDYDSDFWTYAYTSQGLTPPTNRPKFIPHASHPIPVAMQNFPDGKRQYARIAAASFIPRDRDIHTGNIAVTRPPNRRFKRFDYSWGCTNLNRAFHPHSRLRNLPGFGPSNHFLEDTPREFRITIEMAEELERVADITLNSTKVHTAIDGALDELNHTFGLQPLIAFAQGAGVKNAQKYTDQEKLVANTRAFLHHFTNENARALQKFACEIRVGLCFKKDDKGRFIIQHEEVNTLMTQPLTRQYLTQRLFDGKFHFREKQHKSFFNNIERDLKNQLYREIKAAHGISFNVTNPRTIEELQVSKRLISEVRDIRWRKQWEKKVEKSFQRNLMFKKFTQPLFTLSDITQAIRSMNTSLSSNTTQLAQNYTSLNKLLAQVHDRIHHLEKHNPNNQRELDEARSLSEKLSGLLKQIKDSVLQHLPQPSPTPTPHSPASSVPAEPFLPVAPAATAEENARLNTRLGMAR